MPEKVSLSKQIIKVSAVLSFITVAVLLGLMIFGWLNLGPSKELRQLAGADFLLRRGLGLTLFSLFFGFGGLITSSGISKGQRWSWFASLFIAVLLTLLFPLGTIFGLKLLVSLFSPEVKEWFWYPENFRTKVTDLNQEDEE